MASQICPLLTLLQEQTWASLGMVGDGGAGALWSPFLPNSSSLGGHASGSLLLASIESWPYSEASPTRMPPRSLVPSRLNKSFLYDPLKGSSTLIALAVLSSAKQLPKLATSTPMSLSLVDISAPLKAAFFAEQVGGGDLRHFVAGRDEAVNHAAVKSDLADGKYIRIGSAQMVVHDDAAALTDHQAAGAGQIVARLDAGRDDDHLHVQFAAVDEGHAFDFAVAENFLGVLVEVNLDAERVDLADQHARADVVDLPRHQPRGELDDVRFQAEIVSRLRRFQAE